MGNHIINRFPGHVKALREIIQKDAKFAEICADYEEMCTWLDFQCRAKDRQSNECELARRLIWNLEDEIIKTLMDTGCWDQD